MNAQAWNSMYPVGTPIRIWRDRAEHPMDAVTQSPAWDAHGVGLVRVSRTDEPVRLDDLLPIHGEPGLSDGSAQVITPQEAKEPFDLPASPPDGFIVTQEHAEATHVIWQGQSTPQKLPCPYPRHPSLTWLTAIPPEGFRVASLFNATHVMWQGQSPLLLPCDYPDLPSVTLLVKDHAWEQPSILRTNSAGVRLICEERADQLGKHGYTIQHDIAECDKQGANLLRAAMWCINSEFTTPANFWPWPDSLSPMAKGYCRIHQLKVAGALIAAEIDRIIGEGATRTAKTEGPA